MRDRGRRRQGDVSATEQTDDLPHAVQGGPAVGLDLLEQGSGATGVEVTARVGGRHQLTQTLLQQCVKLAGEPGPVSGDL